MIISGIVIASRPENLSKVSEAVTGFPWAEVHYSDPNGRLVVSMEATDLDESMDRLGELQNLPSVLSAALAEYCMEEADA